MKSHLYYGIVSNKNSKSKTGKKTNGTTKKSKALDRSNRPWNLNTSYLSQISMSPQRRFQRKGANSLVKSKRSFLGGTLTGKPGNKKYKPGQFGTMS